MRAQKLFDAYTEGRHWDHHPTSYAEYFSDFLKKKTFTGIVIDVGCGNGRDVAYFASAGFDAAGIDYSPNEITGARGNYPTCHFEVQKAERMTFADESIGAIYTVNVVHYLDQENALREFSRVLKPGGYLFMHFNRSITDAEGHEEYSQDEKEIEKLVSEFETVEKTTFERIDLVPKTHTHSILQLILRKPE